MTLQSLDKSGARKKGNWVPSHAQSWRGHVLKGILSCSDDPQSEKNCEIL